MAKNTLTTSPLERADIDIRVHGPIATTELTQTFVNQTEKVIEAVYQFPLPRTLLLAVSVSK